MGGKKNQTLVILMLLNRAVNSHFTLCMYVHGPAYVCECTDKHTQSVHVSTCTCMGIKWKWGQKKLLTMLNKPDATVADVCHTVYW